MLHTLSRMIVGLDQALNPLFYGGSENVTLSSQSAYRELIQKKSGWERKAIDWLFRNVFGQSHHCYKSLVLEAYEFAEKDEILAILATKGITAAK